MQCHFVSAQCHIPLQPPLVNVNQLKTLVAIEDYHY